MRLRRSNQRPPKPVFGADVAGASVPDTMNRGNAMGGTKIDVYMLVLEDLDTGTMLDAALTLADQARDATDLDRLLAMVDPFEVTEMKTSRKSRKYTGKGATTCPEQ